MSGKWDLGRVWCAGETGEWSKRDLGEGASQENGWLVCMELDHAK